MTQPVQPTPQAAPQPAHDEYYEVRLQKLKSYYEKNPPKYPGKFDKEHFCAELKTLPDGPQPDGSKYKIAGRIMFLRDMGKLCFAHVQDPSGKLQIAFKVDALGVDEYKFQMKHLDIGDYVGIEGHLFTTQKGEKTLVVEKSILLSKALRGLPEKWHGLADPEIRARQRYLDLIMNADTRKRFEIRHKVMKFIRNHLDENGFLEVETPMLQALSSGASARPFITHHNALDIPLYLRIAPETYLKRLISGGYERVFEMGKCFRNEGVDASHLQEFTMLEYYAAYWDYRDNMKFIQTMLQKMIFFATGSLQLEYQGTAIDFSGEWPEVTYRDLVMEHTGIDLHKCPDLASLQAAIKSKGLELDLEEFIGSGALIDGLYKKYCRTKLIKPCFVTMHPTDLVPLARRSDGNPMELDMFQVVVNTWEIVKAYSELVDPVDQRARLMEQQDLAKAGDEEAMMLEEDFILAMEHGMPPMSGLGLGIDRMVALLSDAKNIRDVIYFPSLRPE
jgi:lysyl-tRNA synthetase class 2